MTKEVQLKVNTTGSAGAATGFAQTAIPVSGFIESIQLTYDGSAPALTTDVTITEVDGHGRTILTRTNTATNGVFYPRVPVQDTLGANIAGEYTRMYLAGAHIKVQVDQCDALSPAVTAKINLSEV